MKFNDFFNITAKLYREESIAELTIRLLGIDISLALYGNFTDWVFPFSFLPGIRMRGILAQVLFLAVYIGRLRKEVEVKEVEVDQTEEDNSR